MTRLVIATGRLSRDHVLKPLEEDMGDAEQRLRRPQRTHGTGPEERAGGDEEQVA